MHDFRMPDSYYDPPEYDGCEDCMCEDPEHAEPLRCHCTGDCECEEQVCDCSCHNLPPMPEYDEGEYDRADYNAAEQEEHF